MATFFSYVLATRDRSLSFGTTNNLFRRIGRHRAMDPAQLLGHSGAIRLVLFEEWRSAEAAVLREQQLNRMAHGQLVDLINARNPAWRDLSADWFIPRRA